MPTELIGKTIVAVYLATDKKAMRFDVEGADPIIARVDGDCCSSTWIESIDAPDALLGTVHLAEDIPMPHRAAADDSDGEVIAYYGFRIATERGACVIDYRNESNGYYGGNLSWPGDGYYYGGVYGQNISTEEWRQIAPEVQAHV